MTNKHIVVAQPVKLIDEMLVFAIFILQSIFFLSLHPSTQKEQIDRDTTD